jgi:hypothetical protein
LPFFCSITLEPRHSTQTPSTTHSSSLLLQLRNSAHLYRWSTDTHHRKHMSCARYPASPLARWLDQQKTHHVTATRLVNWSPDCCLATTYKICPLRHSFHCCTLESVYGAVAWQCVIISVTTHILICRSCLVIFQCKV